MPRGRKPSLKIHKAAPVVVDCEAPLKPLTIYHDEVASAEWDRAVSVLRERGTANRACLATLVAYASAYSRVVEYRAILSRDGPLVETEAGGWRAHPMVGALSAAERSLARFAAQLGMTPGEGTPKESAGGQTPLERLNARAAEARSRFVRPAADEG